MLTSHSNPSKYMSRWSCNAMKPSTWTMEVFSFHKSSLVHSSIQPQPMRCFFCFDTKTKPKEKKHCTDRREKRATKENANDQKKNNKTKPKHCFSSSVNKDHNKWWKNDFTIGAKLLTKLITAQQQKPFDPSTNCKVFRFSMAFRRFDRCNVQSSHSKCVSFLFVRVFLPLSLFRSVIWRVTSAFLSLSLFNRVLAHFCFLLAAFFCFPTMLQHFSLCSLKQRKHIQIFMDRYYCNCFITCAFIKLSHNMFDSSEIEWPNRVELIDEQP